VAAVVTLGEGAPGTLMATTACYPGFSDRIELIFARATARLEGGTLDVFFHDGTVVHEGEPQALGGGADPMAFPHDAHRALIADFLDALDGDREPMVSGADAVATRHLIDALLA